MFDLREYDRPTCASCAVGRQLLDKERVTVQSISSWFSNRRTDLRSGVKKGKLIQ